MSNLPRACIIGAGSSGIAAAKKLKDAGIVFDLFEKSDRVGGNWAFENPNGMSAAYRSLHINTSRERMEYADYPMPKRYPDFPKHTHIYEYFNAYVDEFGLREQIAFECGVEHAARRADGVWEIALESGETREYDALLVANGHHWDPAWPEPPFPGSFDGVEMHSHSYVDAGEWAGKRVVVLGMGNSAMDIAVESSFVAEKTLLAARRGAHILPKYVFGRPSDQIGGSPKIPFAVRRKLFQGLLRLYVGRYERYGLPVPDHRFGDAHPTISSDILSRISHGEIESRPNIASLEGDAVRFADGSVERADVVVYCTGYRVKFPFFDPGFVAAPGNQLPLFRRVLRPGVANLFFIGLLQPLGAIMPIAERQGRWVAEYLRGEYALPPRRRMEADIRRDTRRMERRYVKSRRHTMQVDFDDYMHRLEKETRSGRARAEAAGGALPVPPLAMAPRGSERAAA